MAIKKSQLYASLWSSCDKLRGSMDPTEYKDYILVLLFVKYVSDKARSQPDYLVEVPAGGSFADMVAAKGKPDIGSRMNAIVTKLADANEELKGAVDDANWDDPDKLGRGKEMVDRISDLVSIFETQLDFGANRAEGDDLLGDAYEFLMRKFATLGGKSKGEYYTPAEVSRIMAKVVGMESVKRANQTIYDPTCGSGSLLIKAHDEAKRAKGLDLAIYGQELNNKTRALAQMNTVLHSAPTAEIWGGDSTLANPHFRVGSGLKTFDFIVANPPFSLDTWMLGFDPKHDEFNRFPWGIPPSSKGDYAFILHVLASLKSEGKAVVVAPHGDLYRGNAEGVIRREIVKRGYIKGIIGLPPNLFYGTGIAACLLVIDKSGAGERDAILMIDASRGFTKEGDKNRLREQDVHRIVDTFAREVEIEHYSRGVPLSEVEANGYNLSIPRYIDPGEPEDIQDIEAHLRGGIPDRDVQALAPYWDVMPGVRSALFTPDRPGYAQFTVDQQVVSATILEHAEFAAFRTAIADRFAVWASDAEERLRAFGAGGKPKALIGELSEKLLVCFRDAPLIDAYDVYQRFMEYADATLQDDLYLVSDLGWAAAAKPRPGIVIKEGKKTKWKEPTDFLVAKKGWKSDLLPVSLLVNCYFAAERDGIAKLETDVVSASQAVVGLAEEYGGEEGLLVTVLNEKGALTKTAITKHLKEIRDLPDMEETRTLLERAKTLLDAESKVQGELKAAIAGLDSKIATKFDTLTDAEIVDLVTCDKWRADVYSAIELEVDRISRRLTSRVATLASRYGETLSAIATSEAEWARRVAAHLRDMGFGDA
jgi:type I restriction enzyme M protein